MAWPSIGNFAPDEVRRIVEARGVIGPRHSRYENGWMVGLRRVPIEQTDFEKLVATMLGLGFIRPQPEVIIPGTILARTAISPAGQNNKITVSDIQITSKANGLFFFRVIRPAPRQPQVPQQVSLDCLATENQTTTVFLAIPGQPSLSEGQESSAAANTP